MIVMQGTTVDGLHVIAEGTVAVWIKPKDKPSVKVATLGPGQVFGERSILEFGVAGATIKAVEDSLIFIIPSRLSLALMESNPALKEYFMRQIEDRRKAPWLPTRSPSSSPAARRARGAASRGASSGALFLQGLFDDDPVGLVLVADRLLRQQQALEIDRADWNPVKVDDFTVGL